MRLTWRDAVATVLVGGVVAAYAAFVEGADLPVISGPRALAGFTLVVGLTACGIGGEGWTNGSQPWAVRTAGVLGAIAMAAALVTVIIGSVFVLAVLVGTTVALWILATLRHALTRRGGDDLQRPAETGKVTMSGR
jgi:hypothetical protein